MRAFSFFSGIWGFDLALQRKGIEIIGHSEIDKYAEFIYARHFSNKNYGDIQGITPSELPDFDLLVGGFPCQDLSCAKSNTQGLQGSRSGLFFKLLAILQVKQPKYFIVENIASMKKETCEEISQYLGVKPTPLDSAKVTAQMRKRLFWTNIEVMGQPGDKEIYLQSILESGTAPSKKSYALRASYYKWSVKNCLKRCYQGVLEDGGILRKLTPIECERLQGFPDNWTKVNGVSNTQRLKGLGNAVTVPVIEHILSFLP